MALIVRNLLGIAVLLLIAYIFSANRRAIRLRTVVAALLTQIGIGAFILFVPFGKSILDNQVVHFRRYSFSNVSWIWNWRVLRAINWN